jgi:undecaprenyl-diphosphatase
MADLNVAIFQSINGLAGKNIIFDYFGIFFAEYLQYFLGLFLLLFLALSKNKTKNALMALCTITAALLARFAVKGAILLVYLNPRPYADGIAVRQLVATPGENFQSFPSGHALFFFAAAAAIYCYNKKLGLAFFAAAALISFARVFAGVHWPLDIIGGAILGTPTGWLTFMVFNIKFEKPALDLK